MKKNINKKGISKIIAVLILIIIILIAALGCVTYYYLTTPSAPTSAAVISGETSDSSTGEPIAGATVTCDGYSVTTGSDGAYSLIVPTGNYTLTISMEGYDASSQSIAATEEQTYTVDASLMKSSVPAPAFVNDNTYVYESGTVYQFLDPHVSAYDYDNLVFYQTVETLLWYNKSSSTDIIPWLAENYTVSEDGLHYNFTLRQGITFQDGTPLNATAVWFSLNRLLIMDGSQPTTHGTQAAWTVQQFLNRSLSSAWGETQTYNEAWAEAVLDQNFVEIIDDSTVKLNLMTASTQVIPTLASHQCAIISPTEAVKKDYEHNGWNFEAEQQPNYNYTKYFVHMAGNGDTYFNVPEEGWTFGTGPYYFESVDPVTYKIVLKAYDAYWGGPDGMALPPSGKTRIEEMDILYVLSFATRMLDLRVGTATAISVGSADAFSVIDRTAWINNGELTSIIPQVTIYGPYSTMRTTFAFLCCNITNPDGTLREWQPFADSRIRMAFTCSVNLTDMNIYVNNRFGTVAPNLVAPGTFPEGSFNPDIKPAFSFNLTKAKESLLDAYEHPLNSKDYTMHFYNGSVIPAGVVDNSFGPDKPRTVDLYVSAGATTEQKVYTTIAENLNTISRDENLGLSVVVIPVPGGQQYSLANLHRCDSIIAGYTANHVIPWIIDVYPTYGSCSAMTQWSIKAIDDLCDEAVEADKEVDIAKLVEKSNEATRKVNEANILMPWWQGVNFFTCSSWLKGWYMNTALNVEVISTMYYES